MQTTYRGCSGCLLLATLAIATSGRVSAQEQGPSDPSIIVNGRITAGPEIDGVISARNGDRLKITSTDGSSTIVVIDSTTQIKARRGLFSGADSRPSAERLLNGLPVNVKTFQTDNGKSDNALVASQITFNSKDLRTATMISNGTSQRFDEQSAATESLRARIGDIDKYNIKSTTNVHFETGRSDLSSDDKAALCTVTMSAQALENALILVVGYTDSTGGDDVNQQLSERRAARVINFLQQTCGWKPYRMLTPTGMAKADPMASNDTAEGKAMNRRVAVNILVSKSVDGF